MHSRSKLLSITLIFFFALAFIAPGLYLPAQVSASKPDVTTKSASSVEAEEATLNGEIDDDGGEDIEEYGFYYGTSDDPVNDGDQEEVGESIDEGDTFKLVVDDLEPDTLYYFCAYAINDDGEETGAVRTFTTDEDEDEDEGAPTVITDSATGIGSEEATLNAEIDDIGDSDIEEYGFYWGEDRDCDEKEEVGDDELDEGDDFDLDLEDLEPGTTYYFKAYAKNDDGTDYGSVKSFTTEEDNKVPTVTTSAVTTSDGQATLNGVITDIGDSEIESYGFYWGTSSSPETKVQAGSKSMDDGDKFSYKLTGISPGTYYVEAYATNSDGTGLGGSQTFEITVSPSVLTIGSSTYRIRGVSQTGDVAPYIKNSRTFLPIRPVAYALGIDDSHIMWDAASQTVTLSKDNRVVQLRIGSNIMTINGISITLDAAPEISNSRTCLPIALVAQAFGATVTWDAATQTVTIL